MLHRAENTLMDYQATWHENSEKNNATGIDSSVLHFN